MAASPNGQRSCARENGRRCILKTALGFRNTTCLSDIETPEIGVQMKGLSRTAAPVHATVCTRETLEFGCLQFQQQQWMKLGVELRVILVCTGDSSNASSNICCLTSSPENITAGTEKLNFYDTLLQKLPRKLGFVFFSLD